MKPPLKMLIEKYRNNLYTAAFNVCKNAQDAEDVVQDTFLQYWSQKKEFETEQHIRARGDQQGEEQEQYFFQAKRAPAGGLYGNPGLPVGGVVRIV